jgi:patatin-like phospholipase/acyl hydrolase
MIRILSIDGGGIRGLIPALVLEYLESRLEPGRHLADCFDIIAGASTGGLIALLLTTPDAKGRPKYTARDIAAIYEQFGKGVFSQSFWQWIKSGNGWWGAKYSAIALEQQLQQYLGDICLKNMLSNVLIPAYEIELDKTFFFKSSRAKTEPAQDCYCKDLARATCAAPTYFPPATLIDGTGRRALTLIDGGVGVNNPTLAAAIYAKEIFGEQEDFFIVSLGTGTNYKANTKNIARKDVESAGMIGWAPKIISLMMYAVNDITNYEMTYVFNTGRAQKYYRLQSVIESPHTYLDNVQDDNLAALKGYAQNLLVVKQSQLDEISTILNATPAP